MSYYRIRRDNFAGFEVQVWRWWFPIWVQLNCVNTHSSVEKAEAFLNNHSNNNNRVVRIYKDGSSWRPSIWGGK